LPDNIISKANRILKLVSLFEKLISVFGKIFLKFSIIPSLLDYLTENVYFSSMKQE